MTTTTAALYIPKVEDLSDNSKLEPELSSITAGKLISAAKLNGVNIKNFNFKSIGKYMVEHVDSEFTQRYAVGALTKILNGQAVTNKTMLDSLFNTYAPVLNAGLYKTGYNSLMAMKDAVTHGTINPSNFLSGLSTGIETINNERTSLTYKNQNYEEIPIDVVEKCEYEYKTVVPEHAKSKDAEATDYISNMQRILVKLHGHVKNDSAELWDMNDFSYKISDAMSQKKLSIVRIGRTIYEDVVLADYNPVIENIHDIHFVLQFYIPYMEKQEIGNVDEEGKLKIVKNELRTELRNKTATTEYIGPSKVETLTKDDLVYIRNADNLKRISGIINS